MPRRTLLALPLLALAVLAAAAQEPKKDDPKKDEPAGNSIKIHWYGQSMFDVETARKYRIVFDPHAIPQFAPPRLSADVTLVSHPHNDHSQLEILKEKGQVFQGVKEVVKGKQLVQEWVSVDRKVGLIRIRTLSSYHDALNGMQRGKNSVWIVDVDGLTIVHLGDLGHELSDDQVKAIGKVDVLMVPVGGIYTINGEQAKKVVKQLKPRLYVLPMHYGISRDDDLLGPDEFLDEQKNVKKMLTTNELVIPLDMKAEEPTIVLLGWKQADPKKEPEKK
jgi:L-ascorbate metabolism protein UlaG (beta-lactamase superfamily)